ncbi:MAG: MarR family transcriptional regulator [Spirochaetales bacterium]|nr:MarR family transcriptional regulator [Spirochaetales bacterium]
MPETTNTTEEIPLLSALPQLYSLIISCSNPKHFEITKSQLIVMVALSMHRMLTMSEVARYISSSREQATRTVESLVGSGFVERHPNPANRTHVYVSLTDSGRELMARCRSEFMIALSERLGSHLTEEETETLRESVLQIIRLLNKVI